MDARLVPELHVGVTSGRVISVPATATAGAPRRGAPRRANAASLSFMAARPGPLIPSADGNGEMDVFPVALASITRPTSRDGFFRAWPRASRRVAQRQHGSLDIMVYLTTLFIHEGRRRQTMATARQQIQKP